MTSSVAFRPMVLPNGTKLKNRIAKAAMEENLADVARGNQPSQSLATLYKRWGEGGAGLILSGHVMIDPLAVSCPGDVVLAEDAVCFNEQDWIKWIKAASVEKAQFWIQINHPGRQVRGNTGIPTYAPSAVAVDIGLLSGMFQRPQEMSNDQITEVIRRFAWTARKAEELGASGVEIHAAHGYLISSFLSARTNRRTDAWGGSLKNRSRLLFDTVKAVRQVVSRSFGVAVKINSSDFQRGGFTPEDLHWVVRRLNEMDLDFIELSGGNVESPAMKGSHVLDTRSKTTIAREAYFLESADALREIATMPILVTGGIRRWATVEAVCASSDKTLAGMATALALVPDLPNRWAAGEDPDPRLAESWILPRTMAFAASTASAQWNLHRIASGYEPDQNVWPVYALLSAQRLERNQLGQYQRWLAEYQSRYSKV